MKTIGYFIALPFLYLLSVLPFGILYFFANIFFFFTYRIIKYRVSIVRKNIRNVYPEKSDLEIERLVTDFYHHYCNTLIETIKILNISEEQLKERVTFENLDLYKKHHSEGKSVFVMMGHQGNWEVAGARMAIEEDLYQLFVYYQPFKMSSFIKPRSA